MDVSTPPSLDLACPQAKVEIEKYVHMFRSLMPFNTPMIMYMNMFCE